MYKAKVPSPLNVVGFRCPLQNHKILGSSCSCAESFNVFSWSEDLVLINTLYRSDGSGQSGAYE